MLDDQLVCQSTGDHLEIWHLFLWKGLSRELEKLLLEMRTHCMVYILFSILSAIKVISWLTGVSSSLPVSRLMGGAPSSCSMPGAVSGGAGISPMNMAAAASAAAFGGLDHQSRYSPFSLPQRRKGRNLFTLQTLPTAELPVHSRDGTSRFHDCHDHRISWAF